MHAWLREQATRLGIELVGGITQPYVHPWSTVFRAATASDAVFLKVCGPSQAFEPRLTERLARDGEALVPGPLAVHPTEPWMILADGGPKLRDALEGDALLDAWARILPRHAALQRRFLGRDDELLALGLPDRRLDRLAAQLDPILDNDRILSTGPDRLTTEDRVRIRALLPIIAARCAELASLGIGATAEHDDLHDGNVLVGRSEIVFDWGDACLTHPFLVLCVSLRACAHRAGIAGDDARILRIRDAYLSEWTDVAPMPALREAAELARVIGQITRTLCWHRVVTLVDGALESEPDAVSGSLRQLEELLAAD